MSPARPLSFRTASAYFMRPMQRPHRKFIDTIEYNLEQLNDLSLDELDLLKETVYALIGHVERLKEKYIGSAEPANGDGRE